MQLTNLLLFLFASTTVLALPEAEAAKATKKTTVTRTARKTTKDPPRPTGCNNEPYEGSDCTANYARLACTCYEIDPSTGNIDFGTCTGPGECNALTGAAA